MKRSTVVQVVAAVLVVLGGLALAFAEERRIEVKVEASDAQNVVVMVNGERHELALDDLAVGEQRTFSAGEHTIVVTRVGDELEVELDGHGLGAPGGAHAAKMIFVGEGEHADEVVVEEGDGAKVRKKVVIVTSDDADGAGYRFETGGEKGDFKVIRVDDALKVVSEGVVFRCSEDGTTLRIARDKATQPTYICPVCGRVMEKVETPEVKVMTWVTKEEESPETD